MSDIRKTSVGIRLALAELLGMARSIWGPKEMVLDDIAVRLMVGVGDIARLARDEPGLRNKVYGVDYERIPKEKKRELEKELGNVLFSTVRWIDELGLDPIDCLELAIEAQRKFAGSGRPR